ncbi:MAG: class I SAM-dependent methyltransferase [Marinilabiliaceae bacterium]|nr:class I SAM-dependent methyltransferase [Marinilabiliaceae bacterium]
MNIFQVKRYISYLFKARHWKGFGIHSPFVYDFVVNLLSVNPEYYCFRPIRSWKNVLRKNRTFIEVTDYGSGSKVSNSNQKRVCDIINNETIPMRYGELLFRMINNFAPEGIIELGTSLGISTLYLGLPKRSSKIVTIEGCPNKATIAKQTFKKFKMNNIELIIGTFSENLINAIKKLPSFDFLFIDGDHRKDATLNYFNESLDYVHNNTIIVFDDIHLTKEMETAWNEIVACPKVTISIDIFRFGIVFFRNECQKQHFVVRF